MDQTPSPTPDNKPVGLQNLHNWCGGKSHFIILLCIFLGLGYSIFAVIKNHSDALWPVLTFLAGMSGVQVQRSIGDDKFGK